MFNMFLICSQNAGLLDDPAQCLQPTATNFLLHGTPLIFPSQQDFSAYLAFSGIVLHNAQLYETSQLENRRNQVNVAVF